MTRSERAWQVLGGVLDPEVPALSVVDLGIVRDVIDHGDELEVVLTPTYSGCPATEVIEQGVSGMIVDNEYAAVQAVSNISSIDRAGVRACFERRFTAERMADDYLRLYRLSAVGSGKSSGLCNSAAIDTDETCGAMQARRSIGPEAGGELNHE